MKYLIILVLAALTCLFYLNAKNTYRSYSALEVNVALDSNLMAFDPDLNNVPGFVEIEQRMSKMIATYKHTERNCSLWNLILNLVVTVATGLAALIATISTIKNNAVGKPAAITIALITFITSILSVGQSQVTVKREKAQKDKEKVIAIRDELEALKPDELKKQISTYNRRLDEEFD